MFVKIVLRAGALVGLVAMSGWEAAAAQSDVSPVAPGTSISHLVSEQVMVADHNGPTGFRGGWRRYEWQGDELGWARVDTRAVEARFGYGGVVAAANRRQNTGTTPAGTFGVVYNFGAADPGSRFAYRRIQDRCDWWDQRPASATYNRWLRSCRPIRDSERLIDYRADAYRQAVVLDFNYSPRDRRGRGTGAGIFLHYSRTATSGCVGLTDRAEMRAVVRWLDPAKNPQIVVTR